MPLFTYANAVTLARGLLNVSDAIPKIFTDAALTPYVQLAIEDLKDATGLTDLPVHNEVFVGTVNALATTLASPPTDIITPLFMEEKAASDVLYIPMVQKEWEPNTEPGDTLHYWTWREETIVFVGCKTVRTVRLRYSKDLTAFSALANNCPISTAKNFLAKKIAAYAAAAIGENYTRAEWLNAQAEISLDKVIRKSVKAKQGMPVRRRAHGSSQRSLRRSRVG